MGYRSDICVAVNDNVHELLQLVRKVNPHLDELLTDADTNFGTNCNKYYWTNVKWYEGYVDVDSLASILSQVRCEDWAMVKVGEETTDIEITGEAWDYDMYVSRSIEW